MAGNRRDVSPFWKAGCVVCWALQGTRLTICLGPSQQSLNLGVDPTRATGHGTTATSSNLGNVLIVVSPAKSLDYESPLATKKATEPRMLDESARLIGVMVKKTPGDLQELMHISPALAELNFDRFQDWQMPFTTETARQAVLAFSGDVYLGLEASTFSERDFTHAQKVFRILSGLYGVLRPLDLMMPYRLEMGSKVENERGKDLYSFWKDEVTKSLAADIDASPGPGVLINLASNEYFGAVDQQGLGARIVSPVFLDSKDGGTHKIVSFFAKKARGSMSQFLIKNRISSVKGITEFDGMGYGFDASQSTPDRPVFIRSY